MGATGWILLILLIIYIPLWVFAWKDPRAAKLGLQKYGPLIKINTRLGVKTMDRVCKYRRFWRAMGVLSQVLAFVLMAAIVYTMVVGVINLPSALQRGGIGIEYALAIPGLNPLLPFWYGLIALIIALVFHEFAHGVQTRANGMRVQNTGLLYGVVPLGAFVEPDQSDVDKAPRRVKLDLFSAGIATNFVIGAVAFLLFSTVLLGGMSTPYDDNAAVYGVSDDSPAYDAGIPAGAIIYKVNGEDFEYTDSWDAPHPYTWHPGDVVTVSYITKETSGSAPSEYATATMRWGVYIPDAIEDGPADKAGIGEGYFLLSMDGHEFYTAQEFSSYMKTTEPGQTSDVVYIDKQGNTQTSGIVLGSHEGVGYLGIYSNTSGMNVISPDILLETATDPFYGYDSPIGYATGALRYLSLPFSGFDPVPDSVEWWFGDQSELFWMAVQLFYWIFWINILLGISNALPAFPFDGGYIFLGWVDALLEKLGKHDREDREKRAMEIASNVSTLMIFLFILVIIAAVV